MHSAFDTRNTEILIRMGYFGEFGSTGKLLRLYDAFHNGENRFSKTHVPKTQELRLARLRELEKTLPEEDIPDVEQAQFEALYYGTPLTIFPKCKGLYVVLEVDDKYTPKLKLYSLATGKTGIMKIWKSIYRETPVVAGDIFKLINWETKSEYRYMPDKTRTTTGRMELWIKRYEKVH